MWMTKRLQQVEIYPFYLIKDDNSLIGLYDGFKFRKPNYNVLCEVHLRTFEVHISKEKNNTTL